MTNREAISKLEYLINSIVSRKEIDETCFEVIDYLETLEPSLVTEQDFDGADDYGYIPVWTEEKGGDMYWECIPKVAITDPDGIGVVRYWTSRPTDAQREAVKWE